MKRASSRRRGFLRLGLAALLLELAALPAASRAETRDPTDATDLPVIHRLGTDLRQMRFIGESDARAFPVFLTAREARAHAGIHLVFSNAVSVMAEASRLRVSVNDVLVSEASIAAPVSDDHESLDIDLPPGLLEPGYNALKVEVQQRHRVDCSIPATYELWTQLDPAATGFTFAGQPAETVTDLADLPALAPAGDGTIPLRLVAPKGIDAAGLDRLLRAVETVAVRGRFAQPSVEVVPAPVERPGLDIMAGTLDQLKAAGLAAFLSEDQPVALRAGTLPGHAVLVLSGQSDADVETAIASLLTDPGAEAPPGTPAGLRALALSGGKPVEGGSVMTLRDLGVTSQEFSGRLFRTGFDILMPPDFYAADYGKMTLRIDAGYAAGLDAGSQILVRVNDKDAASLALPNQKGDVFRERPITVPLSHLRPGFNHVQVEAQVGMPADRVCDPAGALKSRNRFVLLDDTSLELPEIARIAHMPSLSATAASGFPYIARAADTALYIPHPDGETVAAAAEFLARAAIAAGLPLSTHLVLAAPPAANRSAIVIGAFADVPSAVLEGAGVDFTAMRNVWSHIEARSVATQRLNELRAAAGRDPMAGDLMPPGDRDGSNLFKKWSDNIAQGQWRIDPYRLVKDLLESAAGLSDDSLPHWSRQEGRYEVASEARLLIAQHEAPGGAGATWTLLLAPTHETLAAGMRDLVAPSVWNQLDGRIAAFDPQLPRLAIVPAVKDYFIPTATLSPGNLRLIAAGWLSSSIEIYVLSFLGLAIALGTATTLVVRRYGVKS